MAERPWTDHSVSSGLRQQCSDPLEPLRLGVIQRRLAIPVGDHRIGSGCQKGFDRRDVVGAAVSEHHGLHQRRPTEVVYVIEGCSPSGEKANDFVVAQVRRSDQRSAVVGAGDEVGAIAEFQRQLHYCLLYTSDAADEL